MKSICIVAIFLIFSTIVSAMPFDSARCLALGRGCGRNLAGRSGVCAAGRPRQDQSDRCHSQACAYCRENRNDRNKFPCSESRRFRCSGSGMQPPAPAPAPSMQNNGRCTFIGTNKIVINLGGVPRGRGWTAVSNSGMRGIGFDVNRRSRSIVPAGTQGVMCFNLRLQKGGQYYTTAITAAPHSTEHNDVWIRAEDTGFRLLRRGQFRSGGKKWLKGFQNRGRNLIADQLKTIDHNGHYLVTDVRGGQQFRICLSGRSSRFQMFKVVLVECFGNRCAPGDVRGQMQNLSPSRCV